MQSTKLFSVSFQCCITQQSIVRFILILLTCVTCWAHTPIFVGEQTRKQKDSEILIMVSERLLESTGQKRKPQQLQN